MGMDAAENTLREFCYCAMFRLMLIHAGKTHVTYHVTEYPDIVVVENQAKALQMYKRVAVCASVVDASCDAGGRAV